VVIDDTALFSSFASPVIDALDCKDPSNECERTKLGDVTADTVIDADNSIGSDPCDAKAAEANA
jgi:hypothetical protein